MPESDTIFRAARTLNRALAGRVVTRFETQLPQLSRVDYDTPLAGRTIDRVEASGKWLRIFFSGDLILVSHMLMSGSWHIYRAGEPWQRGRIHMRAAIYTDEFVAVAFDVPIAEFHTAASLERDSSVQASGPDVLAPDFDADEAVRRLRAHPEMAIGEALLRQQHVAGIGNIFKSEACFASRVHPFRLVGSLSDDELQRLVANARKLMQRSAIAARAPQVYRRAGQPCPRCGEAIESRKSSDARVTFFCRHCQIL
jgi:endonuclease-8